MLLPCLSPHLPAGISSCWTCTSCCRVAGTRVAAAEESISTSTKASAAACAQRLRSAMAAGWLYVVWWGSALSLNGRIRGGGHVGRFRACRAGPLGCPQGCRPPQAPRHRGEAAAGGKEVLPAISVPAGSIGLCEKLHTERCLQTALPSLLWAPTPEGRAAPHPRDRSCTRSCKLAGGWQRIPVVRRLGFGV